MLSLFRRTLCCVIALQMVLTPLYGSASAAAPVVMVSDTLAQKELLAQVDLLIAINGQLFLLNKTQTETNTKLDQILGAIKYIPDPKIKGPFPTTNNVLIEFSSSLYAAYTSDSIAYNAMKEAAGVLKANPSAAPAATPTAPATTPPAPTAPPAPPAPTAPPAPPAPTAPPAPPAPTAPPAPPAPTAPPATTSAPATTPPAPTAPPAPPASIVPPEELAPPPQIEAPEPPPQIEAPEPPPQIEAPEPPESDPARDPWDKIADFTDVAVQVAADAARTFYNLQNLQNCGNAINCASAGLNVVTGILGTLKNYGINIGGDNFQKTLGYVGAALSFASLVTNLFSGGLNVQKLLEFINGMQQNILFSAIAKGGLLTNDTNESKILRIMSNFTTLFGYVGLFALRDTNAVGWIVALNNFSQIGAATKDTPKSGSLSTDTPLAGPTNPANQAPTTEETAEFLRKLLKCNREIAKTTAQCKQMEEANKRLFLGQLKSRCAAAAISKQQVPAKMFQELFTGTGNKERCKKTAMYDTKNGEQLCTSIALLQVSSLAEGSVMSQMNVLIGLSMFNLVMTNVNTEQVILQNACASLGDLIESGAPVYQPND